MTMNLGDLKELHETLLAQVEAYKTLDGKVRKSLDSEKDAVLATKMLSLGLDTIQEQADDLSEIIAHVEEMMCHIGENPTRKEIEQLLILSIDLWDAPF